jgi:hypothetical protein
MEPVTEISVSHLWGAVQHRNPRKPPPILLSRLPSMKPSTSSASMIAPSTP